MAFTPRLSINSPTQMENNPWWYSTGNPFYPDYGLPNCTCYAYGRYAEIRGAFADLPRWDAKDWWDNASAFNRGQTPRVGAVICFSNPRYGHVAIVEEVHANGDIVTSNSDYGTNYFYTETLLVSNGYIPINSPDYVLQGFIYNDALQTFPISDYVVAAICGNFSQESYVNPGVWENLTVPPEPKWNQLNVGFGLGQWTNTDGDTTGRLYQLHQYLSSNGYSDGDGNGQLEYLYEEGVWYNNLSGYSSLFDYLQSTSTDLENLTNQFKLNWEGNHDDTLPIRLSAATQFLQAIQARQNDDPSQYEWISSNTSLEMPQQINNVMCIYFYVNGYVSPSPTPPTPTPGGSSRKKFPIWMMYGYIFRR